MPVVGLAPSARSLLSGVFGRLRGFGPPGPPPTPVATSIAVSPNGASIGLAQTQQLTATIQDQFNQPFSGTVSWSSSNEAVATVSTSGLVTPVAYGSVTITATFNALSTGVTLTVQQPTQVAITTQPSGAITGSAFSQQPVVRLRDAGGTNVAESGRTVTATIQSGSGVLIGTTSVNTDNNGVATFSNLAIEADAPPSSFALAFSATGLTGATSASFAVSASSFTPNEPSGFTTAVDAPFIEALPIFPSFNSELLQQYETQANLTLVSDATAPRSGPSTINFRFPAGMTGGGSPARFSTTYGSQWFPANTGSMYVSAWIKVSPNWSDNGNAGTKFFFVRSFEYDENTNYISHYANLTYAGSVRFGFNTEWGLPSSNLNRNMEGIQELDDGNWHQVELLLLPGTPGQANGTVRTWVDGVLEVNVTDVQLWAAGQVPQWRYIFVDPTYGGGFNPVPVDQYLRIDHFYVSVA